MSGSHLLPSFHAVGKYLAPLLLTLIFLPSASFAAERFTVLLDWFINPDHAPLIVAQQKGFFAEEGLDLRMVEPADPNAPPRLLAAGEGDVAISYQPQLYLQIEAGLPVSRIATLIATPLNTLVGLEDGKIQTLADLKGARVGYSIGGFEEVLLATLLAQEGLGLDDVELVNVNFALSPSLLTGQVDAVIGAFRNFELNQLEIEGHKGKAFYLEEHGVPVYDELIVLARNSDLNKASLRAFIRGIERGVTYLINHPEESWELFKSYNQGLDNELNRRAFRDTLTRFALRPAALDRGRYQAFGQFVKDAGMIKALPVLDSYAVEISGR
jgi:putative hydroxymethylpyrimidine transport system substrate-binding protein